MHKVTISVDETTRTMADQAVERYRASVPGMADKDVAKVVAFLADLEYNERRTLGHVADRVAELRFSGEWNGR